MIKRTLSVDEMAKLLRVKRDTIYKRIKSGAIPNICYEQRKTAKVIKLVGQAINSILIQEMVVSLLAVF